MEIKRSVLVPYAVEDMFDLIEQAEDYPHFLPWCVSSRIIERSDDWVGARIDFKYLQVRFGFQTRNPKRRPEWLHVRMVEGPFRHFHGDWLLTPLGAHGCRINFDLSYEVSDGLLDRVAARAVEVVARSMMDAFVKRAEDTLPTAAEKAARLAALPAAPPSIAEPPADATPPAAVPNPVSTQPENTMTTPDPALYEAVRACPLAAELDAEQARVLAELMQMQVWQARDIVAPEDRTDDHLYVVVEGELAAIKSVGTPDERLVVSLRQGDFAHELGFLDGSRRYASLVAMAPSRVLMLKRESLEGLIQSHPLILYRVMCAIVRTVHRIQTRLSVQSLELTNYIVKQNGRY